MDSTGKLTGGRTPARQRGSPFISENINPNACTNPSPSGKFVKSQKVSSKIADYGAEKFKNRKFIFTKKKNKKKNSEQINHTDVEEDNGVPSVSYEHELDNRDLDAQRFLAMAYENLRVSQEKFFLGVHHENGEKEDIHEESEELNVEEHQKEEEEEEEEERVSSSGKRRRERLMDERNDCGLGSGSEKVKNLVTEFERLLTVESTDKCEEKEDIEEREEVGARESLGSLHPSELVLTSECLGLNVQLSSSWEYRGSTGGRRKGRNMCQSLMGDGEKMNRKRQQARVTNQKPFNLITEVRGRMKEEQFERKIREMEEQGDRWRIPVAHGLPWTTDQQESLIKPPVKECTVPLDTRLHSEIRAVERSEFDHQVEQKMIFIEHYKMERARREKIEQEEEIKRLRKELIPKAQPLPYFDRPFVPRRSEKSRTIPREPKFHLPQHKKLRCLCSSWNDNVSIGCVTGVVNHEKDLSPL